MMTYCKAYKLNDLRQFHGWKEKSDNGSSNEKRSALTNDSIIYLHENFIVTDGIFGDKYIIFDDVSAEWMEFCQKKLNFAVPDYARTQSEEIAEKA